MQLKLQAGRSQESADFARDSKENTLRDLLRSVLLAEQSHFRRNVVFSDDQTKRVSVQFHRFIPYEPDAGALRLMKTWRCPVRKAS